MPGGARYHAHVRTACEVPPGAGPWEGPPAPMPGGPAGPFDAVIPGWTFPHASRMVIERITS